MKKLFVLLLLISTPSLAGYSPFGWQGWLQSVATITDAPSSGVLTGSVVFAQDNDELYYWDGSEWTELSGGGGSGTVTSVSVVSANGFAGTVANPTTTPAITMETSIMGLLHGNGTAIAAETVSSPLNESSGTLSCQTASGSQSGCLSSANWTTFNSKQSALTFSDSLSNSGGTVTLANDSATPGDSQYYGTDSGGTLGYFDLPDNGITQLTGDGTAIGPGDTTFTLAAVNSDVGSYTNASITVNAKGLITAASSGSGVSPGGSSTDVQYNSSGAFAGNSGMTYDGSGDLTLTGKINATTALLSNLTASSPVFSDSSKNLTSSGTVGVANGGTGFASDTAYEILAGGTTSTAPFAQIGIGTSGQVLTSNGTGALPSFQAGGGGGGTVTSVTASSPLASSGGTTPNISFTGTLGVANGGTGLSSDTAYEIFAGGTTSTAAHQQVGIGTSGQFLMSNGAGALASFNSLPGSVSPGLWSGWETAGSGWTRSSATFGDFNTGSSITYGSYYSNNISCVNASSDLPAITCTLPQAGYVFVCANVQIANSAAGSNVGVQIVDGSGNVINGGTFSNTPGAGDTVTQTLCGQYNATTTTPTFKIYGAGGGSGTISLDAPFTGNHNIEWSVFMHAVSNTSSSGTGPYHHEAMTGTCSSSSSITTQTGSWASSLGNISSSCCALTIATGEFTSTPMCVGSVNSSSVISNVIAVDATSATNVDVCFSGTPSSEVFNISCDGAY